MLYIFYGTDVSKSKSKARLLVDSLLAKRSEATLIEVDAEAWAASIIEENIGGQGLFSSKYIIFLNQVAKNEVVTEEVIEKLPLMKESSNIFIICEGAVKAPVAKAFSKHADKVVVCDLANKISTKKEFNIFALADAFGSKDYAKAWVIYRQAVDSGMESESILGTLFWQVKSMIMASGFKSATEAGLNPFVYSKSVRYAKNYSQDELQSLSEQLIKLYHDGHRGLVDLEMGVERWMLSPVA